MTGAEPIASVYLALSLIGLTEEGETMKLVLQRAIVLMGTLLLGAIVAPEMWAQPAQRAATSAAGLQDAGASSSENLDANYPSPDDIIDATEPTCNLSDLQRRLEYPEPARRRDIEGRVIVRVLVDAAGVPVHSFIDYTDHDLLSEAAQRAVMETRFTPGEQHGKPVAVWVSVPVVFSLK
jgi:protein TonB